MRIKIFFLLLITNINVLANSEAVFPDLANIFTNIRDFTLYKNEAYFSAQSALGDVSVIIRITQRNEKWLEPVISSFSGKYHDLEPFITVDGKKLFFASNRPLDENDTSKDYDIWYVLRQEIDSKWSEPINLGNIINSQGNEFYPSLSVNNNLYFTANKGDSKGGDDIYMSEYKEGKYQKSISLSKTINSKGEEYNAYIAPDETYLIFGAYKREDGFGSGDLYMSLKENNSWSQAKNLGAKVNSKFMDYCPFVDASTNILYFTSKRSQFENTEFSKVSDLIKELNRMENGMSRIYKASFKPVLK